MAREPKWTATRVLDLLQSRTYKHGAFAMLREVKASTGFRGDRWADAIICSCWPSRGIWIGGVEVKISRSDWLSELSNPRKSAEIQRYCSYWTIVTPPGIVERHELPETWGLIEVGGKKNTTIVPAPKLNPEPLDPGFVASILRQSADCHDKRVKAAVLDAEHAIRDALDAEPVESLKRDVEQAQKAQQRAERDLEGLRERIAKLQAAGIDLEGWASDRNVKAMILVERIGPMGPRLAMAAKAAKEAADNLKKLQGILT